ncbi:transaldolase [uncultured Brachyspira sp.]|uniref:transaldolase n=1 Tax=uncultured Brachyspira sp. TaxID=221953 RepID=UPI0025DAB3D8|nr:transaldolase [uncultured Brachyspira sp.]
MKFEELASQIKIFADGADIETMRKQYINPFIKGFTSNPSIMKRDGVKSYKEFSQTLLSFIKDKSISFEIFSDNIEDMEKEALEIAGWGKNVCVKIPITNSKGEYTSDLIKKLSEKNVNINVTAIFTIEQVKKVIDNFSEDTQNIISIFAGRIADAGVDPMPIMKEAVELSKKYNNIEILWASPREVYNAFQARDCNVHIITCSSDMIEKLFKIGAKLEDISLDTVKIFVQATKDLGFSVYE